MTQRKMIRETVLKQEVSFGAMPVVKMNKYERALSFCQNVLNFHHDKSISSWEKYLDECVIKMYDHYNIEADKKINEENGLS